MALKPCRACKSEVDTSAISCPNCGATRPAHSLSLQTYNLIILSVQVVVGLIILYFIASAVWEKAEPFVMKSGIIHHQHLQQQSENNNNADNQNQNNEIESESVESESESESETESETNSNNASAE